MILDDVEHYKHEVEEDKEGLADDSEIDAYLYFEGGQFYQKDYVDEAADNYNRNHQHWIENGHHGWDQDLGQEIDG